jgi:hypothetical protein
VFVLSLPQEADQFFRIRDIESVVTIGSADQNGNIWSGQVRDMRCMQACCLREPFGRDGMKRPECADYIVSLQVVMLRCDNNIEKMYWPQRILDMNGENLPAAGLLDRN